MSTSEDEVKTFRELGLKDDDVDALRGVLDAGAPGVTDEE